MSDDEVGAFLAEHRKVQVATNGPGGFPHLSTLFYGLLGGTLVFWTYAASQKAVNLGRDPRMSCLVEDGEEYSELRGATLYGRAEVHRDPAEVLRAGAVVGAAMSGLGAGYAMVPPPGTGAREALERAARKRVAVHLTPERTVSWDHSKL
ncbi:PPOX class F420-dependent oxidoreductase [Nocardiopsis coralliicola]